MIKQLSDIEHILLRPAMYIGAVTTTKTEDFFLENNKIIQKEISYVPGLAKIINEIIDNAVDVAIKSKFTSSNQISIKMDSETIEVQDNGTGIPCVKDANGVYLPRLVYSAARTGSNFDDDENRTHLGVNGVGSFATNCFSKKFIAVSDDGNHSYKVEFGDNVSKVKELLKPSTGKTGVVVKFWPDLERFGLTEIDEIHQDVIRQRLINLSMSFPEITFKFNGKKVNVGTFKKFSQMFHEKADIYDTEQYRFAIAPNAEDDFRQFSYVNGLKIPDGGTHIDTITKNIVDRIRDKLIKRYKNIKPADIRNKLMVVSFMTDFPNAKFNSQAKEKITNSQAEMTAYFGDIPFDDIANRIFKNKDIMEPITEVYRIREEFKKRQDLKALNRPKTKIRSEKYLAPIGKQKYLFLVEGESARGGLTPVIGRKEVGYYTLKGKPLNAWSAPQSKFTSNKELSELYQIIQNTDYEYIVFATDQDLDGMHIRGLLLGFIMKYLPEYKEKVSILQTPVMTVTKNKKLSSWHYNLGANVKLKAGEVVNYKKGLGSWKEDELKEIVERDGLETMINLLEIDSEEIVEDWLGSSSEARKEYILENDFSIAKL